MNKKVLFLSRHRMTNEQEADLMRIYPDCLTDLYDGTVESSEQLLSLTKGYDVLAAVLPFYMYVQFFKIKPDSLDVIFAKSKRVPTGKTVCNKDSGNMESQYTFVHDGWMKIESLDCSLKLL